MSFRSPFTVALSLVSVMAFSAAAEEKVAVAPGVDIPSSERRPDYKDPTHGALEVHDKPLELGGVSSAVEPIQASAAPAEKTDEKNGSFNLGAGLFGLHAAVGIPHPLTFGIDWQPVKLVTVNLDFGKAGLSVGSLGKFSISNFEVSARLHPFQGAFYVGASYGRQSLKVSATKTYAAIADEEATVEINLKSGYWTPTLGWIWGAGNSGITFGLDFGYLMPISPNSTTKVTMADATAEAALKASSDYQKQEADLNKLAKWLGKKSIPFITLARVGYLF